MVIEEVAVELLRWEMDSPIRDAQVEIRARECMLTRVRTRDGIEGIGEAGTFGGTAFGVKAILETRLAPMIVGSDPTYIAELWDRMYKGTIQSGRRGVMQSAIAGIDLALWDILGKAAGLPVHKLLGSRAGKVRAYGSGGFYEPGKDLPVLAAEMEGIAGRGYRAAKMKVGHLSAAGDAERVRVAREGLGPDRELMIDANNQMTPHRAVAFARMVESQQIAWFEEPTWTEDTAGAAFVRARISMPVAGYETETSLPGFKTLIDNACIDIAQPDAAWAGGISECQRISAYAAACHLGFAPHNYGAAVSGFANLNLLCASPTGYAFEMDQNPNPLRSELVRNWPVVDRDGLIEAPQRPGLGFEIDEKVAARYRVA